MKTKKSVLFVCLGNICRSPLAEGILKKKLIERGIQSDFIVDSCGTSNYHIGEPPDQRSVQNAALNGIILDHQGRQLHQADFERFDHIFVMDQSNYSTAIGMDRTGSHKDKLKLIREFDPVQPGADVPDPYYGGEEGFQNVFDILDRSIENWLLNTMKN